MEPSQCGALKTRTMSSITGWQLIADQVMREQTGEAGGALNFSRASSSSNDEVERLSSRSNSWGSLHQIRHLSSRSQDSFVVPKSHSSFYSEYCLLEEVGRGAYGRVAKARRRCDGRLVVVKEIRHTCLTQKEKDAATNEVQVLASMSHPNIVRYYDCFSSSDNLHIVMEFCDVGDLGHVLKQRQGQLLPEADVMLWFVQICLALQHVHDSGILHRDLKTCNIFCTSDNLVKLGDFGISKVIAHEASLASTVVGTPYYLSPEICNSKPYGLKSDIWALGCILYEMCALKRAFDADALTAIVLKVMRGQYEPLPACYSQELRGLLAQLLSLDAPQRPTVAQILDMPFVQDYVVQYHNLSAALAPSLSNASQLNMQAAFRLSPQSPDRLSASPSGTRMASPFARSEVQWLYSTRLSRSSTDSPTSHSLARMGSSHLGMAAQRDALGSPASSHLSGSLREAAEPPASVPMYRSRSNGAGPSLLQQSSGARPPSAGGIQSQVSMPAALEAHSRKGSLGASPGQLQDCPHPAESAALGAASAVGPGALHATYKGAVGGGSLGYASMASGCSASELLAAHRHNTAMHALKGRASRGPLRTSSLLSSSSLQLQQQQQQQQAAGAGGPGSAPGSLHSTMRVGQGLVPLLQLPADIQVKLSASSSTSGLLHAPSELSGASSGPSVADEAFPAVGTASSSGTLSLASLRGSLEGGVSRHQSSEVVMAEEQRQALSKLQQLKLQLTIGHSRSVTGTA